MMSNLRWAALALLALPGAALAGTRAPATAIGQSVEVRTVPEKAVPDDPAQADPDQGLEAREALGQAQGGPGPGTLNGQYAALQQAAPAPLPTTVAAEMAAGAPEAEPLQASAASVAVAPRIVQAAEALADYVGRGVAIAPDFADAAGVSRAVQAAGSFQAAQVQEGLVAYVALSALQDTGFVAAVRAASEGGDADALAAAWTGRPETVAALAGPAGGRSAARLAALGAALARSGAAVRGAAYTMQRGAWSRALVTEPQALLASVKARSALPADMPADEGHALLASLQTPLPDAGVEGGATPTLSRGLALAALAVIGRAGEEYEERVAALLAEPSSAQCLKMARLDFYQCMAVAGPQYEDVFCLGEHALKETAQCVATAAGAPRPGPAVTQVASAASSARPARAASLQVAIASGR